MTTIDEEDIAPSRPSMDEFFDFEEATTAPNDLDLDIDFSNCGPYSIPHAFVSASDDENTFSCLQHFNASPSTPLGPDDFTDFPRWIEGMDVPLSPCAYCSRMRIHCKILKEGLRKGSCTSCVALSRSCSLTHTGSESVPALDTMLPREKVRVDDACVYCKRRGLQCVGGERDRSCANCVAFACPCSLNTDPLLENRPATKPKPSSEDVPKIGARFSRDSLRILRNWLSTHHSHPYPSEEEKEALMHQTGLNKTQVTNWLANARRRHKIRPPRSTSPSVRSYENGIDIPRRATPALENMNPLERWKNSPPEHEPASITDITKAVSSSTFSSGRESPYTRYGKSSDEGSARSICNVSSTSSLGTSHSSGGSFASAYSHKSHGSFGSFGTRGRRRRRAAPKPVRITPATTQPARTYQCTFCTETFKTKHDWQRHEKSLHLSLERWVCCPTGYSQFCADYGHNRCVFCGLPNPSPEHAETHNFSSCADRTIEERTFYRKDHLRQHLNLVHDVKFQAFSMDSWKVATPQIRSRCGFCGMVMDTWGFRTDHLAEHFKGGKSMRDWKGDWGFEVNVLEAVENGMPPYLIHDERNSMNPFEASKYEPEEEKTLEDMIKIGLVDYIHEQVISGGVPTDANLLVEARKIVVRWDTFDPYNGQSPWFRDLIMLWGTTDDNPVDPAEHPDKDTPWPEKLDKIAATAPQIMRDLSGIECPKQRVLMAFVKSKTALGLTPTDKELQAECCRILEDVEKTSNFKCKGAVGWFRYLISSSSCWMREFRRRAGLPRSSEILTDAIRSADALSIDYSIHNHARLENELHAWVREQLDLGLRPDDEEIQCQARMIVYKNDDSWNQTAVDDPAILHLFKRQSGLAPRDTDDVSPIDLPTLSEATEFGVGACHWDLENTGIGLPSPSVESGSGGNHPAIHPRRDKQQPLQTTAQNQPSTNSNPVQPLKYFLNDVNCFARLVRELSRFVALCSSPSNPNAHIPSDTEIQHHARMAIYSDPDPWNQTAADNLEWLIRFKRDVGLAPPGEGLPLQTLSWKVNEGGSGFSPPYAHPSNPEGVVEKLDARGQVTGGGAGKGEIVERKPIDASFTPRTASAFVRGLPKRYSKPGVVFCSRELENGLKALLSEKGGAVTDEELRAKGRAILGVERTAADDAVLLAKFRELFGSSSDSGLGASTGLGMSKHTTPASFYCPVPVPFSESLLHHPKPKRNTLPTIHQEPTVLSNQERERRLEEQFDAELFGHLPPPLDMDFSDLAGGAMDLDMDFDISNFGVMDPAFDPVDFCGAPKSSLEMNGMGGVPELSQEDQDAFRAFMEGQGDSSKGFEFSGGGTERIW